MSKKGIWSRLLRLFDQISLKPRWVAGCMVLLIMFLVSYETISRYFFQRPTSWTMEISTYLMAGCIFLGAGFALKEGSFITVDMAVEHLGQRSRAILNIITSLGGLVYCGLLTWEGWKLTWSAYKAGWKASTTLGSPLYIAMALIPLGGIMLCLVLVGQISRSISFLRSNR